MPDQSARSAVIQAFIARCGWANSRIAPLAGDASNRRYLRLKRADGTGCVLMDAPPEKDTGMGAFITLTEHLRQVGLRPPALIAADTASGLLLLEDLGDALFGRLLAAQPELEEDRYADATDVLVALHRTPPPKCLQRFTPQVMAELTSLISAWYAPESRAGAALQDSLRTTLEGLAPMQDVLILRDYHADNLIWLGGHGPDAVGLLDYQDAVSGHPAYDLVSLLKDARRDVSPAVEDAMLTRFLKATGHDPAEFRRAYAALGAQRNLRILGVFARLRKRDGKHGYLPLMPRVWDHLQACLAHPDLSTLRKAAKGLPAPTPDYIARLEAG